MNVTEVFVCDVCDTAYEAYVSALRCCPQVTSKFACQECKNWYVDMEDAESCCTEEKES